MSNDNNIDPREMSERDSDAQFTMGQILNGPAGRDAVHIAMFTAQLAHDSLPGDRVSIVDGLARRETPYVGIVDPFLTGVIDRGSWVWIFLLPNTITGLCHVWTHPLFEAEAPDHRPMARGGGNPSPPEAYAEAAKQASEQWLRDFCATHDCPGYHEVMAVAERVADGGAGSDWDPDYMHFNDMDAHGEIPPEFWDHVSAVLGKPIKGHRATSFSCAC